jgi:copper chaperone CopZ
VRRLLALICLPLCPLVLAACGTTTSTANFKGTEHNVAQTVANLQSDITAGEQKKVCANDLAAAVVTRLGGTKGCEATIKNQVSEIDNTELQVESVKVSGEKATAGVKSIYKGKKRLKTVSLVKEGGKWKIASLQ